MVDVKHKKCKHEECRTQPSYNCENETLVPKEDGMVNVKSTMWSIDTHRRVISGK